MSCEQWAGRYALACGELALFVGKAYDGSKPQTAYHARRTPEDQGLIVGDEFLVYAQNGRFDFALVHRPTHPRLMEADE